MRRPLIAAALLFIGASHRPPPARAAEASGGGREPLVDERLGDAREFARYADVSAKRQDAAPVPAGTAWPASHSGRREAMPDMEDGGRPAPAPSLGAPDKTIGSGMAAFPARAVPAPLMVSPGSTARARAPSAAMYLASGAATLGLGLFLFAAFSRKKKDPPPAEAPAAGTSRRPPEPPDFPERPKSTPPLLKPAPAHPKPWPPLPELSAPAPMFEASDPFAPRTRWWGITVEEQRAIERWDRSVEKEYGILGLSGWLTAHSRDLKGVDVPRLLAKLRLDA